MTCAKRNKENVLGYGLLANCDKRRYGLLTKDLDNQYTFGNDNYPQTRQKSYEYAMNYKKYKPKNSNTGECRRTNCDSMTFNTTAG